MRQFVDNSLLGILDFYTGMAQSQAGSAIQFHAGLFVRGGGCNINGFRLRQVALCLQNEVAG